MWRITDSQSSLLLNSANGQKVTMPTGSSITWVGNGGATVFSIVSSGVITTKVNTLDDGSGNLTTSASVTAGTNIVAKTSLAAGNGKWSVSSLGINGVYGNVATSGIGSTTVYGAALRSVLGTGAATVCTFSPAVTGHYRVSAYSTNKGTASVTPTVTVTWVDPDTGAQTATLFSSSEGSSAMTSSFVTFVSMAGTITVTGSAASAGSIVVSASIEQLQ